MKLDDRLIQGFIAGIVGGVVSNILDVISNFFHIDELTYFDWSGIIVYGSKPHNLLEYVVAIFSQFFLTGLIGIAFAYLVPHVTSKNLIIKGGIFGLAMWFAFFISVLLFKIKKLMTTDADSAASDAVTSAIFGVVLAFTLNWLRKRQKNHT